MTIEIIKGCLLDAFDRGDVNVIGHCTNSKGVMGSGIAKAIRDRYPQVYQEYLEFFALRSGDVLGHGQEVDLGDYRRKIVFNLHGQLNYGSKERDLNYGAFSSALGDMRVNLLRGDVIGFPYKIGCDRAKGEWSLVLEMIEFYFKNFQVKIYQL